MKNRADEGSAKCLQGTNPFRSIVSLARRIFIDGWARRYLRVFSLIIVDAVDEWWKGALKRCCGITAILYLCKQASMVYIEHRIQHTAQSLQAVALNYLVQYTRDARILRLEKPSTHIKEGTALNLVKRLNAPWEA